MRMMPESCPHPQVACIYPYHITHKITRSTPTLKLEHSPPLPDYPESDRLTQCVYSVEHMGPLRIVVGPNCLIRRQ